MRTLARTSRAAGAAALLVLGALALHELRYLVAFGPGGAGEAASAGHGYLELIAPFLVVAAVAALVVSVVAPALLRLAPSLRREECLTERAAAYAAALLAVHFAQEIAEGALHAGHAGLGQALGAGGLVVLPLAMLLGALAAFARESLHRAERRLATALERDPLPRPPRRLATAARNSASAPAPLVHLGLGFGIARRPPPPAGPA